VEAAARSLATALKGANLEEYLELDPVNIPDAAIVEVMVGAKF
jgi:hypothetical protein